jgi:prepilin-type N-terminal cleavage/methylation domain-containing protein
MRGRIIKWAGMTLIEILMVTAILSVLGTLIAMLIQRSARSFNAKLWHQTTTRKLDAGLTKIRKSLGLASYPTLNSFKGVIRDRSEQYSIHLGNSTLEADEAYSENTLNLAKDAKGEGDIAFDRGAAQFHYFGSGVLNDYSVDDADLDRYDNTNPETTILSWTSCRSGYQDIPGFGNARPRCGRHRLFLKNRAQVFRASEKTYGFYQDLFLDSSFCVDESLEPIGGDRGYLLGQGKYLCTDAKYIHSSSPTLSDSENYSVGTKLLVRHVATVAISVYDKPDQRSTTFGIEMVTVAPSYGTEVVRKGIQMNVTVGFLP